MNRTTTRQSRRPGVRRVLMILAAVAAVWSLTGCKIIIDGFPEAAAREAADDVGKEIRARASSEDRPWNDIVVVRGALRTVVDLDNADAGKFRPTHTGLRDGNGDGIDDDGQVEIHVGTATACVMISADSAVTFDGRCADDS